MTLMVQWHETRFNYIFVPIPPPYPGLENAARGRRPRAAFSRPRSQFFTIRTSQPANNIFLQYVAQFPATLVCNRPNFLFMHENFLIFLQETVHLQKTSPCGHLSNTDTSLLRTVSHVPTKFSYISSSKNLYNTDPL